MPKLGCECGEIIDLSRIPVTGEFFFFDAAHWSEVVASLVEVTRESRGAVDVEILREKISDALAGFGEHFYRCPRCGGLLVFWENTQTAQYFKKT